jgi:hypothetical protein
MGLVAPVITGITFIITFHERCISTLMSLYFRTFLASFLITFPSPDDIHWHICSFYIIADYDVRFILRDGSVGLNLLRQPHYYYCYCYYYY